MLLAILGLPLAASAPRAAAAPAADTAPPNDATQARMRVSQCVYGGPHVNVYVNGQVAVNGGVPMTDLGALDWSGYLYLAPGTYSVALVPTGQGLDHAVLGPLEVTVGAGHRYSLAALGQAEEARHPPLLLDETAAYQAIGFKPSDFAEIAVNNIKGANSVDLSLGGVVRQSAVAYGDFKAAIWPASAKGIGMTLSGAPNSVVFSDTSTINNPPGLDEVDCFGGHYPGDFDVHSSPATSALNTVSFLQGLSEDARNGGPSPSFNTFLAALQTTGLTDLLVAGGPYLLLAPTDAAFAALPPNQRAALLADPQALADVIRTHIVAGYYPPGSLGKHGPNGGFDRTVTNQLGAPLVLTGGNQLIVNGKAVAGAGDYAMVANGTRLFWTSKLIGPLTTVAATATPIPEPPTATVAPTSPPAATATVAPPTSAPLPPTETLAPPTATPEPPTSTPPPTATLAPIIQPPAPTPGMPTTGAGGGPADLLAVLGAALAALLAGELLRRPARRR
jgi:uncharacterized surface protein with fasciclin (FAS1) repeats